MGVVGVQNAECHGGENHGEVEEERGGDGLLYCVFSDDAVLEVVQVERESSEEILADALADVIPLQEKECNTCRCLKTRAYRVYLYFVVAVTVAAAVIQSLFVPKIFNSPVRLSAEVRLLVLGKHCRRALDDLFELLDRGDLGEVVPQPDIAEEGCEGPRRLEGRLGLLDLARAEDEDEEADLFGILSKVAAVLQARDANVPLLQRRHGDRPAEPGLLVKETCRLHDLVTVTRVN